MEKIANDADIKTEAKDKLIDSRKNLNIFSYNSKYYMDFFLRFISQTTENQFSHDMLKRLRLLQTAVISSLLAICLYCSINNFFLLFPSIIYIGLLIYFINSQGIKIDFYLSRYLINLRIKAVRILNFIAHFLFIFIIAKSGSNGKSFYLSIIITSCSNFVLIIQWYFNSFENLLIVIFFLYCSQSFYEQCFYKLILDLSIWLIIQIIFGFAERNLKENWVLLNSFKRSNNNFKNLLFKCCHKYENCY